MSGRTSGGKFGGTASLFADIILRVVVIELSPVDLTNDSLYCMWHARRRRRNRNTMVPRPNCYCSLCLDHVVVVDGRVTVSTKSRMPCKYVCIATNQPDTKSNPNPNTKQVEIVSVQQNRPIVACSIYIHRNSYETMLLRRFYTFRRHCHSLVVDGSMGRRVAPEKQDGFSYTFAYVHIITSDVVFETKVLGLRRLEDNNKVLVLVLEVEVLALVLTKKS